MSTPGFRSLLLHRDPSTELGTLGVLTSDDPNLLPLQTLELPWRGNARQISSIPPGIYKLLPVKWDKYPDVTVYELQNVPGRSHIYLHYGNSTKDTEGCILLGLKRTMLGGMPLVTNSREAFAEFMNAMSGCANITLEILDAKEEPSHVG